MNEPYGISGLFGVDSYQTHAAAAVIWTLRSVLPPTLFHVDGAVSLSLSIKHFDSGKRTREPLFWWGGWVAHPQRVSCAFFSMPHVLWFRRVRALVSSQAQSWQTGVRLPWVLVRAFSHVALSRAKQVTSPCLFSHSYKMGAIVYASLMSDRVH